MMQGQENIKFCLVCIIPPVLRIYLSSLDGLWAH